MRAPSNLNIDVTPYLVRLFFIAVVGSLSTAEAMLLAINALIALRAAAIASASCASHATRYLEPPRQLARLLGAAQLRTRDNLPPINDGARQGSRHGQA